MKVLEKKGTALTKAENGTYYLPKGNYSVAINLDSKPAWSALEVK